MTDIKKDSNSLEDFSDDQIADIIRSNDDLDQEDIRWIKEEKEELNRRVMEGSYQKKPFRRIWKATLEIISRSLFWFFIGGFLFSFVSLYAASYWWFFFYLVSACACIFYTPNRKALKELLDAWPNFVDFIRRRRK